MRHSPTFRFAPRVSPLPARALLGSVALATLAACTDAVRHPVSPDASAARTASAAGVADRHLVLLQGPSRQLAADVRELGGTVAYLHEDAGVAIVTGLSTRDAARLATSASVADVRPDVVVTLGAPAERAIADAGGVGIASVANPAAALLHPWQWNMRAIGADQAWAAGKLGSSAVTVAILDSGIDYTSLDLAGLVDLARSASFVPSDDALITTYFPGRHPVDDLNGHGTNVATQAASRAVVFAGVTSRTTLIGVKVIGASGGGSLGAILQGVLYAADQGADVINMSLGTYFTKAGGGGSLAALLNRVLTYAQRSGALTVVAAGNESADLDHDLLPNPETGDAEHFPSLYDMFCDTPNVICVSAVGPQSATGPVDVPAYYTVYGRSAISVAAPGGNAGPTASAWPWGAGTTSWIWSMCAVNALADPAASPANPANRPCRSGLSLLGAIGTSQATPHVAGLAALLMAEMGTGNPALIKARIQQSAVDGGLPGTDPYFGKGRIDVARALGL